MSPRRVLIPVVLLLVCAIVLLAYNHLSTGTPALSVSPSQPGNPYPTPPISSPPEPSAAPPNEPQAPIPAVGDPAPDFSLPSASGRTVSLSDYRGTGNVVLLFYRTGG